MTGMLGPGAIPPAQAITFTVSELLASRDAGALGSEQVRLQGFWSDLSFAHSCARPIDTPGELEIYCHDGEFGITERAEPIATRPDDAHLFVTNGPHLTPWVPDHLWPRLAGVSSPTPIVVVGHFDDPRSQECQPTAVDLCRARFVIDDIL